MDTQSMFERFTDRARKTMALANQEAQRFNHELIGPEHILLGLVKEGGGIASKVLTDQFNIDLRKVRLEVEKLVKSGSDMVSLGKLPQSPLAKTAVENAIAEARNLNHNYVGTEHLLLGLLTAGNSETNVAMQVLQSLGIFDSRVREEVLNLLGQGGGDTTEEVGWEGAAFAVTPSGDGFKISKVTQPSMLEKLTAILKADYIILPMEPQVVVQGFSDETANEQWMLSFIDDNGAIVGATSFVGSLGWVIDKVYASLEIEEDADE